MPAAPINWVLRRRHPKVLSPIGSRPTPISALSARPPGRKPRKFFSRLLVWCVLLAFIGMGAWWALHLGCVADGCPARHQRCQSAGKHDAPEDFDGAERE
jgi:hypothetical protein